MATIYYGEINCQQPNCRNHAYYATATNYYCGTHSRKLTRTELPERPTAEAAALKAALHQNQQNKIETARLVNINANQPGRVTLSRILMMKEPEQIDGFIKVFPNYKHQSKTESLQPSIETGAAPSLLSGGLMAFGCARLSPMSLGPVDHGQPGWPPARNLENFHQGSKCFPCETNANGLPTQAYYQNRLQLYNDTTPHRHKFSTAPKAAPLFFVWIDKAGREHRLNYIQSRQFYCNFYQRLVTQESDYYQLQQLLARGYNLQICGYDAHPIVLQSTSETTATCIERVYLDPSKPFGHERVLFTMLTLPPSDYPWIKFKTFDFWIPFHLQQMKI